MSEVHSEARPGPASQSLPARLLGVIVSPGATFRALVEQPKWLGALLTVTLAIAALTFFFFRTEVGQQAWLDQQIRQREAWGGTVTDDQLAGMERIFPYLPAIGAGTVLVIGSLFTVVIAGILYGVFNALLGGGARFKQVLAIVCTAGAISLLAQLVTVPMNYARESMSSATNLGVFLPFLEEGGLLARFFGMIDVFLIWWTIVIGIGLAVLYKRRTGPIVLSLLGVYAGIAAAIAIVMRVVAGGQ
jgi:hypothetical protein